MVLACNPSTQEAEAAGSQVHGQTGPHREAISRRKAKKEEEWPRTNLVPRQYSYNDSETRNQILIQFECVCVFTCMRVWRCMCTFVCTSVGPEDDSGVIL